MIKKEGEKKRKKGGNAYINSSGCSNSNFDKEFQF